MQSKFVKTDKEVEEGSFVWKEARFIFVVVFSHAVIKINTKEGARNRSHATLSCQIPISEVEQGQREYTSQLQSDDQVLYFNGCYHTAYPAPAGPHDWRSCFAYRRLPMRACHQRFITICKLQCANCAQGS